MLDYNELQEMINQTKDNKANEINNMADIFFKKLESSLNFISDHKENINVLIRLFKALYDNDLLPDSNYTVYNQPDKSSIMADSIYHKLGFGFDSTVRQSVFTDIEDFYLCVKGGGACGPFDIFVNFEAEDVMIINTETKAYEWLYNLDDGFQWICEEYYDSLVNNQMFKYKNIPARLDTFVEEFFEFEEKVKNYIEKNLSLSEMNFIESKPQKGGR